MAHILGFFIGLLSLATQAGVLDAQKALQLSNGNTQFNDRGTHRRCHWSIVGSPQSLQDRDTSGKWREIGDVEPRYARLVLSQSIDQCSHACINNALRMCNEEI